MHELTTTRSNPQIDPTMHAWGWEIPVYLFLGGMVAGMMIISGYFLLSGRYKRTNCSCYGMPGIGILLISLGMLALFLDLEHKLYVWRLYTTFQITSPMSWGSWILILVYVGLAANFVLRVPKPIAERLPKLDAMGTRWLERTMFVKSVGVFNMVIGALLGVYTGILLSALGARPLWNSAILGPLFLVSGLSAAAAFIHMVAREREERELLAKADNGFLVTELILIGLFLIGLATATQVHQDALALLMGGSYTAFFWVMVIGLGIIIPLFIQTLAVNHRIQHTPVAPLLVLAGGFMLRLVIVYAGQLSSWGL